MTHQTVNFVQSAFDEAINKLKQPLTVRPLCQMVISPQQQIIIDHLKAVPDHKATLTDIARWEFPAAWSERGRRGLLVANTQKAAMGLVELGMIEMTQTASGYELRLKDQSNVDTD